MGQGFLMEWYQGEGKEEEVQEEEDGVQTTELTEGVEEGGDWIGFGLGMV